MTTSETSARRRTARLSAARGAAGTVCAVLALGAALIGCGSDSGDDAGAPAPTAPSRSAEPSPASPTQTRPSSSPSPTAVKPMTPSTPEELRACADGSCTVVVTKGTEIPRVPGLRAGPFTVSAVGPGGVDLSSVDASGFTSNLLGQRPDQGGPSTVNELSIAVVAIVGDTAKLRLFPAK
ncbi:hypothetical protein Sipo8835_43785 [Streptomyces ipomoeae]|uniref:Uncharacterized protein n=1 Tax=Streptomyces ipomoeae TaxID=103232 RepID=A0AAE8VVJ5_9ACTN|nr:hypothetical protein [Streptomyces ipomoeae]TQE15975.1 hypothetical protein Sipo8835_43785 [Streptomyces ipomoeae]TQE37330.1 hypothetical protein Sipo7851_09505 [Streptomyces ipomoeae]